MCFTLQLKTQRIPREFGTCVYNFHQIVSLHLQSLSQLNDTCIVDNNIDATKLGYRSIDSLLHLSKVQPPSEWKSN